MACKERHFIEASQDPKALQGADVWSETISVLSDQSLNKDINDSVLKTQIQYSVEVVKYHVSNQALAGNRLAV